MKLSDLPTGLSAIINALSANNAALLRQCGALGIKPGERIQVLHRSGSKGPMQIRCRGTLFAIRADEAAEIAVLAEA
ncbi:FeoA family protein [Teredinibacter waterburyi]|jgi:Fe2+ transport system protein A|uniref:FeoA family protein n=1 Tax=Teredinibacter waterburyi TaxID=1500538 RepID=UPI00165F0ECD|nr:FeoA family protein [Teredinibacter waterburyi]